MNKVMVIGSISVDFNVQTKVRPAVGETVKGEKFTLTYGGKGANQAIAAARLDAEVSMVGTVGNDQFGNELIENLEKHRINVENVKKVDRVETGNAHIVISEGDNSIVYIAGANNEFNPERLTDLVGTIEEMDIVVLQNEISMEIVKELINICHELGVKTIYNPAPAELIEMDLIDKVTYLTPNETEFQMLFPNLTMEEGMKKYPSKLIITLGSKGASYYDQEKEEIVLLPAYRVEIADTTGAGDAFNGALAFALANNYPLDVGVKFSNLAAALSIQKLGAQTGMPTLQEVKESDYYEKNWNIE